MFGSTLLKFSEYHRPLVLLVALALMLLVAVSVTVAHAASTTPLVYGLQRDLSALRVQLERVDPWRQDAGHRSVAFNADLGDGSPAFRRLTMLTIARAANRRLERLTAAYRQDGDARSARSAEALRLVMYDLQHGIDRLARASDAATMVVLRDQVGDLLDRAERTLGVLLRETTPSPEVPQTADLGPAMSSGIAAVEPAAPPLVVRGDTTRD